MTAGSLTVERRGRVVDILLGAGDLRCERCDGRLLVGDCQTRSTSCHAGNAVCELGERA